MKVKYDTGPDKALVAVVVPDKGVYFTAYGSNGTSLLTTGNYVISGAYHNLKEVVNKHPLAVPVYEGQEITLEF